MVVGFDVLKFIRCSLSLNVNRSFVGTDMHEPLIASPKRLLNKPQAFSILPNNLSKGNDDRDSHYVFMYICHSSFPMSNLHKA